MSAAARSILVYSIYTFGLGATLLLAPNIPLPIFGLPQAQEVWVRVAGMTVIFLSIFYFTAARYELRPIFVTSVAIRFAVPVFFAAFAAFAAAGFARWNLILFTPFDVLFAIWTLVASWNAEYEPAHRSAEVHSQPTVRRSRERQVAVADRAAQADGGHPAKRTFYPPALDVAQLGSERHATEAHEQLAVGYVAHLHVGKLRPHSPQQPQQRLRSTSDTDRESFMGHGHPAAAPRVWPGLAAASPEAVSRSGVASLRYTTRLRPAPLAWYSASSAIRSRLIASIA